MYNARRHLNIACIAVVTCLLLRQNVCEARMYCGDDNCYRVLGLLNDATNPEIKRAYRTLAKRYHPDKNKGQGQKEAQRMFVKVAEAYEILSDEELRESYDYALAHPEEHFGNQYRYYRARYRPRVPAWVVITGFVAVCTGLKYWVQYSMWKRAKRAFAQQPHVINEAYRLAYFETTGKDPPEEGSLQKSPPWTNSSKRMQRKSSKRSKASKQVPINEKIEIPPETMQRAIKQVVESVGQRITGGYAKPGWRSLFVVQIVVAPWYIVKYLHWCFMWWYKFQLMKQPYGREEQVYLTRRMLKRWLRWDTLSDEKKQELIDREMWMEYPKRLNKWKADYEREILGKRPALLKRYLRNKKRGKAAAW